MHSLHVLWLVVSAENKAHTSHVTYQWRTLFGRSALHSSAVCTLCGAATQPTLWILGMLHPSITTTLITWFGSGVAVGSAGLLQDVCLCVGVFMQTAEAALWQLRCCCYATTEDGTQQTRMQLGLGLHAALHQAVMSLPYFVASC